MNTGDDDELVTSTTDPPPPDFGWPYRVTERIFEWLSDLWDRLLYELDLELPKRPILHLLLRVTMWSGATYLVVLWVCLCYLRFPVSPYSFGDIAKWVIFAAALIWGGFAVSLGAAQLFLLVWLLLLTAVSFTLSLFYLCSVIWNAQRQESSWLRRYRPTMLKGIAAVIVLATFVDGSYRFWDMPFDVFRWTRFVLVGASAWAALFCYLMREKVSQAGTPRRITSWTLALSVVIGIFVYWQAGHDRPEYFLRKNVMQHPKDKSAWLDLASHYQGEGDALAADSGDEDHGPPDPTPSYSEALDCFNRAVELGATGFDVHFSRAQLADEVGQKQAASSFAEEALRVAASDSTADEEDRVIWLREMMARNIDAQATVKEKDRRRRVRDRRRESLPRIVRWPFDLIEKGES